MTLHWGTYLNMKSSHTRYHKFSRIMRYSLVWGWWELRCCREVELGFKLIWQLAELNWKGLPKLNSRVRWFGPSEQKTHKIKTGHTYSYVKLNFRVGLFSCIFWFEAIFCCFSAFYIYPFLHGKNGQNKPKNRQNWNMAKIAPNTDKFILEL